MSCFRYLAEVVVEQVFAAGRPVRVQARTRGWPAACPGCGAVSSWAVGPGERFRIAAPPGIRVGVGTLTGPEASGLAGDIAGCLAPRARRSD